MPARGQSEQTIPVSSLLAMVEKPADFKKLLGDFAAQKKGADEARKKASAAQSELNATLEDIARREDELKVATAKHEKAAKTTDTRQAKTKEGLANDRSALEERTAVISAAASELEAGRADIAGREKALKQRGQELDNQADHLAKIDEDHADLKEALETGRNGLKEREAALAGDRLAHRDAVEAFEAERKRFEDWQRRAREALEAA